MEDVEEEVEREEESVPLFKEDTLNYGSEEVCRQSKYDQLSCDVMLSEPCHTTNGLLSLNNDLLKVDFSLKPPQLDLLTIVKTEKPEEFIKIPRGGDLFDDVKKYRMSWKLIK